MFVWLGFRPHAGQMSGCCFCLDGREIWSVGANGLLANSQLKRSGVRIEIKAGADVGLLGCDTVSAGK